MNYIDMLKNSSEKTGNCVCMGLDPQLESLPYNDGEISACITRFFSELFDEMKLKNLCPAAFKPNLGFYSALDRPREGKFEGSKALVSILKMIRNLFEGIPVILDSKRGDISRSSLNYAIEAFDVWGADAVTVSPYMGSDSVLPFISGQYLDKGAYILNRTSNAGAADFQNLCIDGECGSTLYKKVAEKILAYAKEFCGTGAVAGAVSMTELKEIAGIYAKNAEVPLLIPGVGSQGGSAEDVIKTLKSQDFDLRLARINSSSALTHPWKKAAPPADWLKICTDNIESLIYTAKI